MMPDLSVHKYIPKWNIDDELALALRAETH